MAQPWEPVDTPPCARKVQPLSIVHRAMATSPISRLPCELLTEVFALTLPKPVEEDVVDLSEDAVERIHPHNFLRVCRDWRHVVLSTQSLWTNISIRADARYEWQMQAVTRFLQQCFDLSGNLLLSFYVHISSDIPISTDVKKELLSMLNRSQRRCEHMNIRDSAGLDVVIDVGQLAASPLRELHLTNWQEPLLGRGQLFNTLSILTLICCHSSYLSLLPCAPGLESLTVCGTWFGWNQSQAPLRLERLQELDIGTSNLLEHITCPSLLQLTIMAGITLTQIQSFLERSSPRLLSLVLCAVSSSEVLPILRPLRSLTNLHLTADLDDTFFDEMVARNPGTAECRLCPALQHFTLRDKYGFWSLRSELVEFIVSRCRAPNRASRSFRENLRRNHSLLAVERGVDLPALMEESESLASCIAEGLHFIDTSARA